MSDTAGTAQATEPTALNTNADAAAAFEAVFEAAEAPPRQPKPRKVAPAVEGDDDDADDADDTEPAADADEELDLSDVDPTTEETDEEVDPEADPDPADDEAELIPVKVDGKTERLTLDELKKGYSRTKVFTQKTMEVAETRKRVEAEAITLQEERAQLAALTAQLTEKLATESQEPDWATLRESDPVEWAIQKQVWADKTAERTRLKGLSDELVRRNAAQQEADQSKLLEAERTKLLDKVPAWKKDAAVAAKELAAIGKFMVDELGFSEDEAGKVYDHRAVLALRDAMRFRTLIARQAAREATGAVTVTKGPKPLAPGRSRERPGRAQQRAEAVNRVRQTGLTSDAEKAFMSIPGLL